MFNVHKTLIYLFLNIKNRQFKHSFFFVYLVFYTNARKKSPKFRPTIISQIIKKKPLGVVKATDCDCSLRSKLDNSRFTKVTSFVMGKNVPRLINKNQF